MFVPWMLLINLVPGVYTLDHVPSWWDRAQTSLVSLCVVNNTCHNYTKQRLDSDYNEYSNAGRSPCCTGCSCHPDCHLEGSCCFPSLKDYPDRNRQKCMYANKHSSVRLTSYYMYTECDPDYNVNDIPEVAEQTDPFPMQPVYSRMTERIYYNRTIAQCNGITDGIEWSYMAACNEDVLTFIDDILSLSKCTWWFEYPGRASDLRTEECFEDVTPRCRSEFSVPPGLNMTKDEVVEACAESGLVAPFRPHISNRLYDYIFSNVFCYICNNLLFKFEDGMCPIDEIDSGLKDTSSFPVILKFNPSNTSGREQTVTENKQPLACSQSTGTSACRPVLCPSGQTISSSGYCDFIIEKLFMKKAQIYLKLEAENGSAGDEPTYAHLEGLSRADSPWPEERWKIVDVFCEANGVSTTANICSNNYSVFVLETENIDVDPRAFFDDIKNRLALKWKRQYNGRLIRYTQSLYRHPIFMFSQTNDKFVSANIIEEKWSIIPDTRLYINIKHTRRIINIGEQSPPRLTKMYFCEQVALKPTEYELSQDGLVLRYKARNSTLYFGEFAMFNFEVKICLSDSALVKVDDASGSAPYIVPLVAHWYGYLLSTGLHVAFGLSLDI